MFARNHQEDIMPALLNSVDPEGLEEFSVVFTDRSLNHMSAVFQEVMRDISALLKDVCLLYTSPSPRDSFRSRMPSSA